MKRFSDRVIFTTHEKFMWNFQHHFDPRTCWPILTLSCHRPASSVATSIWSTQHAFNFQQPVIHIYHPAQGHSHKLAQIWYKVQQWRLPQRQKYQSDTVASKNLNSREVITIKPLICLNTLKGAAPRIELWLQALILSWNSTNLKSLSYYKVILIGLYCVH